MTGIRAIAPHKTSFKGTCSIKQARELTRRFPTLSTQLDTLQKWAAGKVVEVTVTARSTKNGYPANHPMHFKSLKGAKSLEDILVTFLIKYPHRPKRNTLRVISANLLR